MNLYLKTIIPASLILCLTFIGIHYTFTFFEKQSVIKANNFLNRGIFSEIQRTLAGKKPSQWEEALRSIQPDAKNPAQILSIETLNLSKDQVGQLMSGKILFQSGRNFNFLNYVIVEHFALQRIGNSLYALKLQQGILMADLIYESTKWMSHLIFMRLKHSSEKNWDKIIHELQIQYGVPLKLEAKKSKLITMNIRQQLQSRSVAYQIPHKGRVITTIYFQVPDKNKILIVGPIDYSAFVRRLTDLQYYLLLGMLIISISSVAVLTWLFSRNIGKIKKLTQAYSQGDFGYHIKFNRFSTLYSVFKNVVGMGNNLEALIKFQQNMTRFVAHETRTPLSTMQFALDSLKKEDNISDKATQNLASIQEDIQSLNSLISYFLLYSQSLSKELKINKEPICIVTWLEDSIKRYQLSEIIVTLNVAENIKTMVYFDPRLLKHALDNLLSCTSSNLI